jgi:hypothetical protein
VVRTSSLMALIAVAGAGCVVVAVIAGFAARHAWIERKIAALTSPPTRLFSQENAALPPKGGRLRVVLIGDSGIARWPTERLSKRWQFVNRGVGGETVGQVAQRPQRGRERSHRGRFSGSRRATSGHRQNM